MPLSNKPHSPTVTVNVNRPFAFFITNHVTKSVLFSGQVHHVNPSTPTQRINVMPTNNNVPVQSSPTSLKYQQPQPKDKGSINYTNS